MELNYRTNNALLETFAVNSLNELSSVSRSGTLTVAGTSTSPASSVNVSGTGISGSQAAAVYADSTWALQGVTPANGQNTFTATATDNYNRTSQASTTVNLPASSTFTYDANGNLLGDGVRSFAYDDENQLTSVWVTNAWRSDFAYDGLMRRRLRKEFTWSGGTWVQTKVRKRMLKNGIVRPNEPVHHWLFHQASKVPEWIKNRPFNLMPITQRAHELAHGGNLLNYLRYGTPEWAWQTAGGFGYAGASLAAQAASNPSQGGGCY